MAETESEAVVGRRAGKIARIVGIVVVAGLILFAIIASMTARPDYSAQVWDERTTLGNLEAKNYYVMYTDIACPYCDVFTRLTIENEDKFEQFIAGNDVLFEVRVTDYLYMAHEDIKYSRDAAEGVYCAKREDRFWNYYHTAVQMLWDDYQSHGFGASKTAPPITGMPDDYWLQVGHKIGLGEAFDNCMNNDEALEELDADTSKAISTLTRAGAGLPYFQFNRWTQDGFDNTWSWAMVEQYLKAGLEKR